jgi:hypothetical protein
MFVSYRELKPIRHFCAFEGTMPMDCLLAIEKKEKFAGKHKKTEKLISYLSRNRSLAEIRTQTWGWRQFSLCDDILLGVPVCLTNWEILSTKVVSQQPKGQ